MCSRRGEAAGARYAPLACVGIVIEDEGRGRHDLKDALRHEVLQLDEEEVVRALARRAHVLHHVVHEHTLRHRAEQNSSPSLSDRNTPAGTAAPLGTSTARYSSVHLRALLLPTVGTQASGLLRLHCQSRP